MNTATLAGNACSVLALCATLALQAGDPPPAAPSQAPGGLAPVKPLAPGPGPADVGQDATPPPAADGLFDGAVWRERLTAPHLDRREAAFDKLTSLALTDVGARKWLQRTAADAGEVELAWTARLALREIEIKGRLSFVSGSLLWVTTQPVPGTHADGPSGVQPWAPFYPWAGSPVAGPVTPGGPGVGRIFVETDEGGCRLILREVVDGAVQERSHEGPTLEAILAEHPELGVQLESGGTPGRLTLRIGPGLDQGGILPGGAQPDPALLGVVLVVVPVDHAARLGLEPGLGALVLRVVPGSYAHLMGIPPGAVLVELQGQPIDSLDRVSSLMATHGPREGLEAVWIDASGQRKNGAWGP